MAFGAGERAPGAGAEGAAAGGGGARELLGVRPRGAAPVALTEEAARRPAIRATREIAWVKARQAARRARRERARASS